MNNLLGYIQRCIRSYKCCFFNTVMSYRSMITFLVAMLLAFSTIIEAQPVPLHRKHYCGAALADILSLACRGNYNQMYDGIIKKRSLNRHLESSKDSGGIVEECCTNQCSMQTIKQYCADGADDDTYGFSSDQSDSSRPSPDSLKSKENTRREKESGGKHSSVKELALEKAGRKRTGGSTEKMENESISSGFEIAPGFEIGTVSPSYFNRPVFIPENQKHPIWNDTPYS